MLHLVVLDLQDWVSLLFIDTLVTVIHFWRWSIGGKARVVLARHDVSDAAAPITHKHVAINEPVSYEIKFRAPQHHEPAYLLT